LEEKKGSEKKPPKKGRKGYSVTCDRKSRFSSLKGREEGGTTEEGE